MWVMMALQWCASQSQGITVVPHVASVVTSMVTAAMISVCNLESWPPLFLSLELTGKWGMTHVMMDVEPHHAKTQLQHSLCVQSYWTLRVLWVSVMPTLIHRPILMTVSLIFASLSTVMMYCAIPLKRMWVPASLPMSWFIPGEKIQHVVSELKQFTFVPERWNQNMCLHQVNDTDINIFTLILLSYKPCKV